MKLALRGLYYLSPFIRDFQNCREVRDLFKEVVGEDVIPHCCFSNVPQVRTCLGGDYLSNVQLLVS